MYQQNCVLCDRSILRGQFCMGKVCFQSSYFQQQNGSLVCFFFLKRFSFLQKTCFKVKAFKTFKRLSHKKMPMQNMPKICSIIFQNLCCFCWLSKETSKEIVFSCVMLKTKSNYPVKVAEKSNHSFPIYLTNHLAQTPILFNMSFNRKSTL